jgi:hypothetical protein
MMTKAIRTALVGWAIVSGISLASVTTVHAVAVTPAALKAAFIMNFVKFTEWPQATFPAGAPLVLCVAGDDAVADALLEIVSHQDGKGRPVEVRRLSAESAKAVCHVFYSGGSGEASDKLVEGFKTARVLTVSDRKDFCKRGGVVELFVDDGQMRFAINIDTARTQDLQLSSRLLSLAKVVRNDVD